MSDFNLELICPVCGEKFLLDQRVAAAVLVGVAVGSFTREAYLGENICWLSKDSGSYLFLVIPTAFVPLIQLIAFVKKSKEQPCCCENDDSSICDKLKTWVTGHKHLLEFGLDIALMSSQVLIALFADDDNGVKDVFFGLFTFVEGLILAVTGISEDEDKKKSEDNQFQELNDIPTDQQDTHRRSDEQPRANPIIDSEA